MTRSDRSLARRLDLTSLQLFVTVCESGSIGRAAEREGIAASAVSKRLSDLEGVLETPLLYRHARGVDLTPAGETLLHHARGMLFGLDKMQGELSEYAEGVRGHIRVHANISAIVQFLPEDLAGFLAQHGQVKLDLEERVSTEIIRAVHEGETDIGICHPQLNARGLQARPYRQDRLVLVVPAGHRFAEREGIRFQETLGEDHVGLHGNSSIYLAMRRAAAEAGHSIRLRFRVTGLDAMCRMVHNRLGVGLAPDRAFELLRQVGDVRAVPLLDDWAVRELHVFARDFAALSVTARLLVDHLCPAAGAGSSPR